MASASVISAHPGMPILSRLQVCRPEYLGYFHYGRSWSGCSTWRVVTALGLLQWWILFLIGWAHTNLTERWQALFARYSSLQGCWPFGFLINITRIIIKSSDRHQSGFGPGHGYPSKIRCKRKQRVCFIYKRISGGSRNGPGRELHGTIWEDPYSKTATGQKTLNTGWGPYLRGPADDVTLHHYRACDICQSFGDVVCVTAPATTVCIHKRQYRSRAW